jgi:hypothetical protein
MSKLQKKRTGRPPTRHRLPGDKRIIPLTMPHGEVLELDAAADRADKSRAAWVRETLLAAARNEAR